MTSRTARDEFPQLADFASRPSGWDSSLIERRREASRALDEIDTLRGIVANLAALQPYDEYLDECCRFCGEFRFVTDGHQTWRTDHETDCIWVRARAADFGTENPDA